MEVADQIKFFIKNDNHYLGGGGRPPPPREKLLTICERLTLDLISKIIGFDERGGGILYIRVIRDKLR